MKIELNIDVSPPSWLRRAALVAIVPVSLVALASVVSAEGTAKFKNGETLSAEKLNKNFANIEAGLAKLASLEAEVGKIASLEAEVGKIASLEAEVGKIATLEARLDEVERQPPAGTIFAFGGATVPAGWMPCDGTLLDSSKPEYKALYQAIGTAYGGNSTSGMFNLPDLRGRFLRGVDNQKGNDPDAAERVASNPGGNEGDKIGSLQDSAVGPHTHPVPWISSSGSSLDFGSSYGTALSDSAVNKGAGSSSETRPVNVAINWIIKL
ncbi:MAG: phage tail protein [Minicystis sp.]